MLAYHTTNLGDDIQSLAARQYLPRVDTYLDRDRLAEYRGPETTLIGNGWFCHDPQLAWPPAPQIRFLALSLHVHDWAKHQFAMHRDYWSPPRTPVGCRDEATQAFFAEQGVDACFSGCLTLTFPPADGPRRGICLVDLWDSLAAKLPDCLRREATRHTHSVSPNLPPEARLTLAQRQLDHYAAAELVITTRLHAALPCVALGTPVLLAVSATDARPPKNLHARLPKGHAKLIDAIHKAPVHVQGPIAVQKDHSAWSPNSVPQAGNRLAVIAVEVETRSAIGHRADQDRLPRAVVVQRMVFRRRPVALVGRQVHQIPRQSEFDRMRSHHQDHRTHSYECLAARINMCSTKVAAKTE